MNTKIMKRISKLLWIPLFFIYWISLTEIWKYDMDENASAKDIRNGGYGGGIVFSIMFFVPFVSILWACWPSNYCNVLYVLLFFFSIASSVTSSYMCAMSYNTNLYPLYKNVTMEKIGQTPFLHRQTHYSFPKDFINTTLYGTSFSSGKFITVYWITDRIVYKCDTGSNRISIQNDGMVWAKGPIIDGPILEAVKDLLPRTNANNTFDQFLALRNSYRYTDGPYFDKYCAEFNYIFFAVMIVWFLSVCIYESRELYREKREETQRISHPQSHSHPSNFFKPTSPIETTPEIEGAVL